MSEFFGGLAKTLNPKGGRGMVESLLFLTLLIGVIFLNYKQIEVSESLDFIIKAVVGSMGYMIGRNADKKKASKEGAKNE